MMAEGTTERDESEFRVLVVEDDADLLELIHGVLAPMEVVGAVNGKDALQKLERVQPDFIVTDIMMPEMDGWELVARVRRHEGYQLTPVVYLTALGDRASMKRGYETGADVYLSKPFEPERLRRNLELFIHKKNIEPCEKLFTLDHLKTLDRQFKEGPTPKRELMPRRAAPPKTPPPPTPPPTGPRGKLLGVRRERRTRVILCTGDPLLIEEITGAGGGGRIELLAEHLLEELIFKVERYSADLILLEWEHLGADPLSDVEHLATSPVCHGVPVSVISTTRLKGQTDRALTDLGVLDQLRRPFEPGALLSLLDMVDQIAGHGRRAKRRPWDEVLAAETEHRRRRQSEAEERWEET